MRTIVLPYDDSEAAKEAAHAAARIALQWQAKVVVVKTGRLLEVVSGVLLPTIEEEGHRLVAEMGAGLVRRSGATAEARKRWGDPAREVVRLAEEEGADLIVIGHERRSWLWRLAHGNVASKVIDRAPCSVLVVRKMKQARPKTVSESER